MIGFPRYSSWSRIWTLTIVWLMVGVWVLGLSQAKGPGLRELAQQRRVLIGAAVEPNWLLEEPEYGQVLAREFNLVVAENVMKWTSLQPDQGQFNFVLADLLMNFAEKNKQTVRGHTLVWHNQLPRWVYQLPKTELLPAMQAHIQGVAGYFKGKIAYWDVVNEAIDDTAKPRETPFSAVPNYIEQAFRITRQADPAAKLFYNDYNIEGINPKSDAVYAMVKSLKAKGTPIDGVGFQTHIDQNFSPESVRMAENLERFAKLGLEIHITEMDVKLIGSAPKAQRLKAQAQVYRKVLEVCLKQPACKVFTLWGFTDAHSWLSASEPLIFDDLYQPKPAYQALVEALKKR
jgi:endo-1,4-beta-xylanase